MPLADRALMITIHDAFTMDADPARLRQLLARLRTRLVTYLTHEEADGLPPITPSSGLLANSAESLRPSVADTAAGAPGPRSRGPSSAPILTSVSMS
jgi:hypothetical protein